MAAGDQTDPAQGGPLATTNIISIAVAGAFGLATFLAIVIFVVRRRLRRFVAAAQPASNRSHYSGGNAKNQFAFQDGDGKSKEIMTSAVMPVFQQPESDDATPLNLAACTKHDTVTSTRRSTIMMSSRFKQPMVPSRHKLADVGGILVSLDLHDDDVATSERRTSLSAPHDVIVAGRSTDNQRTFDSTSSVAQHDASVEAPRRRVLRKKVKKQALQHKGRAVDLDSISVATVWDHVASSKIHAAHAAKLLIPANDAGMPISSYSHRVDLDLADIVDSDRVDASDIEHGDFSVTPAVLGYQSIKPLAPRKQKHALHRKKSGRDRTVVCTAQVRYSVKGLLFPVPKYDVALFHFYTNALPVSLAVRYTVDVLLAR